MALRKEKPEAIRLYKRLTVIFAGLTMVLSWLLRIISWKLLIPAALLVLLPKYLWEHNSVKELTRTVEILLLAAAPTVILVLAVCEHFQLEFFSILLLMQVALPVAAFAAERGERFDTVLMQVAGVAYAVVTFLFCYYYILVPNQPWYKLVLLALLGVVMLVLPFMAYPLPFQLLKRKKQDDDV